MKLNSLKKIIKYRSSYSGTKETDIMYERYFIRNLEKFNKNELNLLISVFDYYSDDLIFQILTKKIKPNNKFKSLFDRIDQI
ncbi:succinate dehydrogenase assembly factor 2 [Alphaproteobacteria bacterium]|jgi:succinate dehydrogenase flavin-adding protein (antitoxin of CptAB toxin-antitoxin module)|nr:succinate dehydrogenase assembly factor 2 [Alphaproteobacteria bacterium]|tara:strand:- start:342 stop:587 length:246 start_codon:yes stop_codon:yes gene_type:complete